MMSGKCRSASSSHQVTWATMSFTDQSPATPGSVSRELDKPAYDAWNAVHAVSSRFRSCGLFTVHDLNANPSQDARPLTLSRSSRVSPHRDHAVGAFPVTDHGVVPCPRVKLAEEVAHRVQRPPTEWSGSDPWRPRRC